MSGAREVAAEAVIYIEELIADMLAGEHVDNEVALGMLLCGKQKIQVQLKVTLREEDFLECEGEEDIIEDNLDVGDIELYDDIRCKFCRCKFCGCGMEGGEMYHDICDQCANKPDDE